MTRRAYPLEAALKLRKMQLDEAQAVLSEALEQFRAAEAALEYADKRLREHREQTRLERQERSAQSKPTTGATLHQTEDYFARRADEADELERVREERESVVRFARGRVDTARAALGKARAEHRAVEQHRERWDEARRKSAENKAEDEADDVLAGRRR